LIASADWPSATRRKDARKPELDSILVEAKRDIGHRAMRMDELVGWQAGNA
jgi:hypothetical protein